MRPSTFATLTARTFETWFRKQFHWPARPYKWLLELTLECNSRCVSCSIWKTPAAIKRQQMNLLELELLFARNGRDLAWLALSGGEVTRYENFGAVVALAKRYCKNLKLVTFTTNGLLPQKALEHARALHTAGFDSFITISLDGDAETHDRIRGVPGNHELAWQTYNLLCEEGIAVHFGITLSSSNVDFVKRSYSNLRSKIKAITIQHEFGIYARPNEIDDAAIAKSLARIDSAYLVTTVGELLEKCYLGLAREFLRKRRSSNVVPCAAGRASLHIRPEGETHICMFMPPVGNARRGARLADIVNSQYGTELLKRVDKGDCPHCWMNCYAPHSILLHPVSAVAGGLRKRIRSTQASSCFETSPHSQTAEIRLRARASRGVELATEHPRN
jgi:MoaA/NifB/PqqE/SkfB family radical SAM enzyme